MPELIDKKRTEAKVFLIAGLFIDRPDHEFELAEAVIHRCCEEIDKQPTIEPEVRHGRWIKQENGSNLCSVCGVTKVSHLPFCGHCGAKMDLRTPTEAALDTADSVMMGGADNG